MSAEGATEEETTDGDEKKKTKPPAWMFNEKGVAYAPWMVDQFDPEVRRWLSLLPRFYSIISLFLQMGPAIV